MPTLNATTTQVFTSVGLSASEIYQLFLGLISVAVSFGLWMIQVAWPFMLAIGFIYLMYRLARRYMSVGH